MRFNNLRQEKSYNGELMIKGTLNEDIIMNLPVGSIILWNSESIPSGWNICDGDNGTPDLRGSFVRGATDDSDLLLAGGSGSHIHTNSDTGTRANHSHTASKTTGGASETGTYASGSTYTSAGAHTHAFTNKATSSGNAHSHTVGNTESGQNLPSYILLYFIMKTS